MYAKKVYDFNIKNVYIDKLKSTTIQIIVQSK